MPTTLDAPHSLAAGAPPAAPATISEAAPPAAPTALSASGSTHPPGDNPAGRTVPPTPAPSKPPPRGPDWPCSTATSPAPRRPNRRRPRRSPWGVVVFTIGLLALLVAGCANPAGGPGPNSAGDTSPGGGAQAPPEEPGPVPGRGTIVVSLPPLSATGVSTPAAQAEADIYEIVAVPALETPLAGPDRGALPGAATAIEVAPGGTAPVELAVAAGSYRVLVLAGKGSGDGATLLASGASAAPVDVEADARTAVTIALTTVTHEVALAPDGDGAHTGVALAGEPYAIELSGDTGCALVTLDPAGAGATFAPQYKLAEDPSYAQLPIAADGSSWSISATLAAPATSRETIWRFSGPYLSYRDGETGAFCALEEITNRRWRWLSVTNLSDSSPLWDMVAVPFSVVAGGTGLDVSISWE